MTTSGAAARTAGTAAVSVAAPLVGLAVAAGVGLALNPDPVSAPAGTALRLALPAGRLLLDACGVAAVGLALLGWLIADGQRRDVEAVRASAARSTVVLTGVWAATAVLLLWLQAAEVAAVSPTELRLDAVTTYVGSFGPGTALVLTAACAVLYGLLGTSSWPASPGLLGMLALLGLLPGPLTGHASTSPAHELAVLSAAAHAAASALWVGGLAVLLTLVATRRTLLATALPRFSRVAAGALVAVALTGVTTAAARLGSVPALFDTGYGRVVLVKAVLLGVLAVVGGLVRWRVLPAVRAHRRAPLVALAGTELVLMAIALGLGAALTRSAV